MSDKNIEPKGSFWTTAPGCITAIGGLVSVIVAAVVALSAAGFIQPPFQATATPQPTIKPSIAAATAIPAANSLPTFTPSLPTATSTPPSLIGKWIVNANNYEGVLDIVSTDNGRVEGTIFGDAILQGSWNEFTLKLTFRRSIASASDPNAYQIYYSDLIRHGDAYVLTGTFEQFTATGKTGPFNWSATR